jgi:hypothetical protein
MSFLSLFSKRARLKDWREDAEKVIDFLSVLGPTEICAARVQFAMGLRYTGALIEKFPEPKLLMPALEALDSPRNLSKAEDGHLSTLILMLLRSQKETQACGTAVHDALGAGILMMVVSLRAAARPELFTTGCALWRELDRANLELTYEVGAEWARLCEGTPVEPFCRREAPAWLSTPAVFGAR